MGTIRDGLANVSVLVEFTPEETKFDLTIYKGDEPIPGQTWNAEAFDPFDYDPAPNRFDMGVFHALRHSTEFPAQFVKGLAGFGQFTWDCPANMTRSERAKYGADQ
ncbi:hypothetical protein ACFTUC_17340 [Streptomyces sp. NPDC056944]|uniref:hypothetical protein n=1 Tax=Streptomyces sp. NPDC056944 TaxID=3345972 RepID=UPI00363A2615